VRYALKARKAVWFFLIRVAGALHPRTGTKLAIRFYTREGMHMVGRPTFIAANAWFDGTRNYDLITLHEGCNISRDVRVLTHDWSPYCTLRSLGRTATTSVGRLEPVEVGPHAFVGLGAVLMPGANIGRGAIIGAGAVVRGRVPDYGVAIGNPATVIGDAREYLQRKFADEWAQLPRNR
jgi:acetyltransferase-like isoleucine patch superfamily enzyme